ncbi:MAG: hypothetical protein LBD71_04880, partial [Treponema sp.]|nr:hypothetical protein [Treponema sp.]
GQKWDKKDPPSRMIFISSRPAITVSAGPTDAFTRTAPNAAFRPAGVWKGPLFFMEPQNMRLQIRLFPPPLLPNTSCNFPPEKFRTAIDLMFTLRFILVIQHTFGMCQKNIQEM